jgi:hypothetical protein
LPGYTFNDWINAVAALLQYDQTITQPITGPNVSTIATFNTAYPRAIEYAEQRIYRFMDLVMTRVEDDSGTLTANSRTATLPTTKGQYIVLEQVAIVVGGVRQPALLPTSKDYLDMAWPADQPNTVPSIPQYWAPIDQMTIKVGPPPDQAYPMDCFGTQRPPPLSYTNQTTILTTYLPDLFLAATMVWWSSYQRDFGAQSENPQSAMSWEQVTKDLLEPAILEEFRKKIQGLGYSVRMPSPTAMPPQAAQEG